jgi:hypothetical protein
MPVERIAAVGFVLRKRSNVAIKAAIDIRKRRAFEFLSELAVSFSRADPYAVRLERDSSGNDKPRAPQRCRASPGCESATIGVTLRLPESGYSPAAILPAKQSSSLVWTSVSTFVRRFHRRQSTIVRISQIRSPIPTAMPTSRKADQQSRCRQDTTSFPHAYSNPWRTLTQNRHR